MKPKPQLFGYLSTTPMFRDRYGKILVPHKVYNGSDFDLCCLFETFKRLQFLPLQSEYDVQRDGMEWVGVSPFFDLIPAIQIPTEYEIEWMNAIEIDNVISIECYYREVSLNENDWILLPIGDDNEDI